MIQSNQGIAGENALFDASEKGDLASVKLLMDARGEDFVRALRSFLPQCMRHAALR